MLRFLSQNKRRFADMTNKLLKNIFTLVTVFILVSSSLLWLYRVDVVNKIGYDDGLSISSNRLFPAYTTHDPIVIDGDSNFSDTATQEGWSGDGSAEDPYIIEGLEIDQEEAAVDCIRITNTQVNFTIRNCNITGAYTSPGCGIYLANVTYGRIEQNLVYHNRFNIYLTNSHYLVVKNNTCWDGPVSISMRDSSSNNIITDNDSSNNGDRGVNLESGSHHNTVINNTCVNNGFGVVLYMVTYNTIANNNFSNNQNDGIHSNNADNNIMLNNTCNVNGKGIYLFSRSDYNEISNNTCNKNNRGMELTTSDYNILTNNTCNANYNGMDIFTSDYTGLYNNTCNENLNYGIYFSSDYCNLSNNVINHNLWGILMILTDYSSLTNNTCNFNDYGIESRRSTFNTIANNTCANNDQYGINLNTVSANNIIEWNAFIENVNGGTDEGPTNTFDYNFWSDYDGNDPDQDGIGDIPYPLLGSAGNQDHHPLMMPPSQVIAWIDPPSNQNFESGEPVIYDLNASAFSGIDSWTINDTINFNIDSFGVVSNAAILPIGTYGLEVSVNDTKGNALSGTFTLTVVDTPPQWTEVPTNQFATYLKPFHYDVDATDFDGLDWWWINDTIAFAIDQDGIVTNATTLALEEYGLEVFVNDTKGNTISATFKVKVLIYAVYDSIVIIGDDDFSNLAITEGWEGAGTSLSPYIIEYVLIDRNDEAGHCISISDTRVHFIIRDSIFYGASVNPGSGIYLKNVTNGELKNNTCFSNFVGIYLYNSSRNSLVSNNCSSNSYAGIFLLQYGSDNIVTDNICHSTNVGIRIQDGGIEHDVTENSCNANSYGIYLLRTSFSTVDNNTCNSSFSRGICLEHSSNNTVSNNLCSNNTAFGLVLYYSHYNEIFGNNFSLNGDQGVHHRRSSYNNIFDNAFNDNDYGYYLHDVSDYNTLTNNVFNNNTYAGIWIYDRSDYNKFSYNLVKNNSKGLFLQFLSSYNEFRWNVIANNDLTSSDYTFYYNLYDHNYWSRYTGSDSDGDGVGDTPYYIDGSSNLDSHPLMLPPGSLPFWVDAPEAQYVELNYPFSYDLDVTIYSFIDHWWLNDTTTFNIDQDGIITNITTLTIGSYGLEVFVNDTSGYVISGSFNVIVSDSTPPTWIELPISQVIEFGLDFYYNLNATDLSGLDAWWLNDTIHFDIDVSGIVTNTSVLLVGTFGIHVWVNDTFGSVLDTTFNVVVVDTTAPSWVTILTDHQFEEGAPFTYSLDADDLSSLHTWWINDTTHFTIDGLGVITNLIILTDGVYPCEVSVNDTHGNTLVGVFTLTVFPATTPTWITEPTDQFVEFGEDLVYDLDATDDSGINAWWLNDTTYLAIDQSGVITNTAPLPVGVHRLLVSVNDLWGHTLSHELVITVADTTAPSWVESPENQVVEYGTYLTYDLDVYDVSEVDWWVDDTDRFTVDWTGFVRSLEILDVGSYGLRIYVSDIYGHELMASIIIEIVDTTPPEWLMTVYDQYIDYGDRFQYQLTAYDLCGIDSWSLNDTVNFEIDSLGLIASRGILELGQYGLSITVIDSFGNELTIEFTIFVITETTTTTTTTSETTTTTTSVTTTTTTETTSTTPTIPPEPDPILTLIIGLGLSVTVGIILVIIILRRRT